MFKKIIGLLLAAFTVCNAGIVISTQSHIKVNRGYEILPDGNSVLITADGGVFRVPDSGLDGENPELYGIENGLPGVTVSGMCKDFRGNYWFATPEGVATVHNQNFDLVQFFSDIAQTGSSKLVKLIASDKYIYLITDKALVRYEFNPLIGRYQVKDSNTNAGLIQSIKSFGISQGNLYLFSDVMRYISENAGNISDIGLWQSNNFPPAKSINQLKSVADKFYALANDGLYEINLDQSNKLNFLSGKNILDLQQYYPSIGSKSSGLFALVSSGSNREIFNSADISTVPASVFSVNDNYFNRFYTDGQKVFATTSTNGFKIFDLTGNEPEVPELNTPNFRGLLSAIVKDDKIVYLEANLASSGDLSSGQWSNVATDIKFGFGWGPNKYRLMDAGANRILAGSWGRGIRFFEWRAGLAGNDSVVGVDSIMLQSAQAGINYPASYAATKDQNGKYWFASVNDAVDDIALLRMNNIDESGDSILNHALKFTRDQVSYQQPSCMIADGLNRLWLGSDHAENYLGLYSLIQEDSLINKRVNFTPAVYSMAIDQENILWIGTNQGAYYINLDDIKKADLTDFTLDKIKPANFSTAGQEIHTIHITENNEKWFGTSFGITILKSNNADIYNLLPNYATPDQPVSGAFESVPMPNKAVKQIIDLPDGNKKLLLFDDGMMVYEFAKGSIRSELQEVVTLPAPFLADGSSEVVFYIPDSGINYEFVKIFDLRGRLVKKISQKFTDGRISWNGRDDNGNIVSSGVYQFLVYSQENSQKYLRGKIAVVRK